MNTPHSNASADCLPISLWDAAFFALMENHPDKKTEAAQKLFDAWQSGQVYLQGNPAIAEVDAPGRPDKPELISPQEVEKRSIASKPGRAILIHALAHIEFNAINLALDAVYRFRQLPKAFYGDWLQVAAEEAYHFTLLRSHLRLLGHEYGDFTAHNGLWEMALKTAGDPLARMALVPRLMEARGLDVTPGMRAKLAATGDHEAASILDVILHDEIGHVAIGNRWFHYLCEQRGLQPGPTFVALLKQHHAPPPRPPFNAEARTEAGFSKEELEWLNGGVGLEAIAQQFE